LSCENKSQNSYAISGLQELGLQERIFSRVKYYDSVGCSVVLLVSATFQFCPRL